MELAIGLEKEISSRLDSSYLRMKAYSPFMPIIYESEKFLVRTASTIKDLLDVYRLRHEIFFREWRGEANELQLDFDEFDFYADHLMIVEKSNDEVIGTYRLISSERKKNFYSENEFEMQNFLARPGLKLELGRACIHPLHRNGNTIDLLWKGLAAYINKIGARWLFGCASLHCDDSHQLGEILKYLDEKGKLNRNYPIWPHSAYVDRKLVIPSQGYKPSIECQRLIPPLLRTYLLAGAKVYGFPAYDREFKCFDLLTVLDLEDLNPRFRERYFLNEEMEG